MSIHTMPDHCMVNIFLRISLGDRIRSGQVCSRWRWLRSVIAAKLRSLTILVGPDALDLITYSRFNYTSYTYDFILNDDGTRMFKPTESPRWNLLQLKLLDSEAVLGLANLFPNICKLTIALDEIDYTTLLFADMLFAFNASKLVTLEMYCKLTEIRFIPQFVSKHFFSVINSLSSLKHLTLEFDNNFALSPSRINHLNYYNVNKETTTVDLPLIAQLDEFNFYSTDGDRGDVMFDSFQRYAQHSQRPLQIQYGFTDQFGYMSKLAKLDSQFCRRFTRLVSCDYDYPVSAKRDLFTLCTYFTSVTRVWVNVDNITIQYFNKHISRLTNLIYLSLSIWCSDLLPDESNGEIMLQSPSVKALDLSFSPTNHQNISQFNIPWTFPNVQAIRLCIFRGGQCDICGYQEANRIPLERLKHCYTQILSQIQVHLSQCSQLHTITEVNVEPLEVTNTPITKPNLMNKIELTE